MSTVDRSSPEFRELLRKKFVETARKYFGVPYAKQYSLPHNFANRFHKPGSPRRKSKLFLDCCGLVRQIVFDLREYFGFILQRYNQVLSLISRLVVVPI